jgi:hypothetical protein
MARVTRTHGHYVLPYGEVVLRDTLRLEGVWSKSIRGKGRGQSVLVWDGPPDRPAVELAGCRACEVSDFDIRFRAPALAGVVVRTAVKTERVSTGNRVSRLFVEGDHADPARRPRFGVTDHSHRRDDREPDQNNDFHTVEDCQFYRCTEWGVSVERSQAHWVNLSSVTVHDSPGGVRNLVGGWSGAVLNFSRVARCLLLAGEFGGSTRISGVNCEDCTQLLHTEQPGGAYEIGHVRFDAARPDPARPAVFVKVTRDTGLVELRHVRLAYHPAAAVPLKVYLEGGVTVRVAGLTVVRYSPANPPPDLIRWRGLPWMTGEPLVSNVRVLAHHLPPDHPQRVTTPAGWAGETAPEVTP